MQPFTQLTSKVVPLSHNNIDTDQIIPARYLKVTDKNGLVEGLFSSWAYQEDGQRDPDFPLNQERYQGAQILAAGDNFGCGSSREHAPWALVGWGIRAVISTSFADIFRNNALKNGLLTITVDPELHSRIFELIKADPNLMVTIDLPSQLLILPDGSSHSFPIDSFSKTCLVEGVDQMGYLLGRVPEIEFFEREHGL
jgi:3-isopropylmalate/(R)-2-methylmalate dehydratase small subunit